MLNRLNAFFGDLPPELKQWVVGGAIVIVVTADYTAFLNSSALTDLIAEVLTAILFLGAFAMTASAIGSKRTMSDDMIRPARSIDWATVYAPVLLAVVAAAAFVVLAHQNATRPLPELRILFFNPTEQSFIIAPTGEIAWDPATRPADDREPLSGTMSFRSSLRPNFDGTSIAVGPSTSLALFGRIESPDDYRRTLAEGTLPVTVTLNVSSPNGGAKLSTSNCRYPADDTPGPSCQARVLVTPT